MATFCSNCGSPLGKTTAFCPKCGSPTGNRTTSGAAAPIASAPIAPAAAQSSSALKIIIVLLCCLVIGGVVVVGAVAYMAHRVKQAVVQKAAENGVDLSSVGSDSDKTVVLPKPCKLLSKDEVSHLIGEPIERAEVKDKTCEYYGPAGLSTKLVQQEGASEMERAKKPGADPGKSAIELQRMLIRMGGANGNAEAGSTGSGGELPLLVLGVSANGRATMNAIGLTRVLFGAASKAAAGQQGEDTKTAQDMGADVFVGANIDGLGDKAMWTPQSGLYVLKGDTLIQVNPSVFPEFRKKSVAVARTVLPKI